MLEIRLHPNLPRVLDGKCFMFLHVGSIMFHFYHVFHIFSFWHDASLFLQMLSQRPLHGTRSRLQIWAAARGNALVRREAKAHNL